MKRNAMKTLSIICLIFLCFSTTFSQTNTIKKPLEYFHQRKEAIHLVKNEKWQQAVTILENITNQYQYDADLFYLLGLSYYQIEQYQKAVFSLKKTLDLGGTILRGIPTGSAPSNDIMIKIAEAYAKDGNTDNAIFWLQKGFASRYDEKPFLKGNTAFKSLQEDTAFKKLFGDDIQGNITREETWRRDITYLQQRIEELHYNFDQTIDKDVFSKEILDIKTIIPSLSDEQIVVRLMTLIGGLGNGHNLIIPTSPKKGALKKLPVQFYQFEDGMFIIDAEKGYEQWIGHKVIAIGNTPIEKALEKTNAVNARDNDMQTLWLGPYYLGLPDVLEGLKIVENTNQIKITLSDSKENKQQITMHPVAWNFSDFPRMPKLKEGKQPLFLSKTNDAYWYTLLPEHEAIYIQFNIVTQKKEQSLEAFNTEVRRQITQNKTQNLILDLRHNHGGNGSILPAMLKTIMHFEVMHPEGKIFVLMGRETFSAGQNLLTDITKYTNPILVGEPSGSKPNHIGEAGWFRLPYSGLMGLISTQFHQTSKAEDHRIWIAPHIPINMSSTDYFSGTDRALHTILELIKEEIK